ncbi:MAG: hypothetical protein IM613_17975 [Cytophagales bacterium]|nr:hypothetical protein [Cytophagales bacterium]
MKKILILALLVGCFGSAHAQFIRTRLTHKNVVNKVDSSYLELFEYLEKNDLRNYRKFLARFTPPNWRAKSLLTLMADSLIDGHQPHWESLNTKDSYVTFVITLLSGQSKELGTNQLDRTVAYWSRVYPDMATSNNDTISLVKASKERVEKAQTPIERKVYSILMDKDLGPKFHSRNYRNYYDTGWWSTDCLAQEMLQSGDTTNIKFVVRHCSKGMLDRLLGSFTRTEFGTKNSAYQDMINKKVRLDINPMEVYPLFMERMRLRSPHKALIEQQETRIKEKEETIETLSSISKYTTYVCVLAFIAALAAGIYAWISRLRYAKAQDKIITETANLEQELVKIDEQIQLNNSIANRINEYIRVASRPPFKSPR